MTGPMNPEEFRNIARCERDLWWYRGMRRILFRLLDPILQGRDIRRVLESGCGTGYLSRILQSEWRLPVVPLDISGEGLRYARGLGVERAVQGDARSLPFRDGSFDLALSLDVLTHLARGKEGEAAREMARVLKTGGVLVLRTSALDALRSRHAQFVGERQRFTRERLVRVMESAGIRTVRCTYANSLLLPVALAKFRIWEPVLRKPVASGVEPAPPWLDRILFGMLEWEAGWIGAGRNFGLGQSLLFVGEKQP
jgi:SAM-dependent methyltransferase